MNPNTKRLIEALKRASIETDVRLWKRIASDLERPARHHRAINVFSIERNAKDGETIIVPGKVLGEGTLTKKVTVAAASFSDSAREKISQSGKAVTIEELMEENPKAQRVRILG